MRDSVYARSRKDGKEGLVYLVINNSWTDTTTVELPKEAEVYALTGNGKIRSRTMLLNGREQVLGENNELPKLSPVKQATGTVELAPGSCTFFVLSFSFSLIQHSLTRQSHPIWVALLPLSDHGQLLQATENTAAVPLI